MPHKLETSRGISSSPYDHSASSLLSFSDFPSAVEEGGEVDGAKEGAPGAFDWKNKLTMEDEAGEDSVVPGMESWPVLREEEEEEEQEPEAKSPIVQQGCDKMPPAGEAESGTSNVVAVDEPDFDKAQNNAQRNVPRLLELTCQFDSAASLSSLLEGMPVDDLDESGHTALHYAAKQHSIRCIEFLIKRRAKLDIKSANGLIALEIALQSERMQIISWSPADKITELLTLTGDKDLTAIKILAGHTRDVVQVASRLIIRGNIIAFAALLTVTGDTLISTPVLGTEEHGDGTLFDVLVKKTISMGEEVRDDDMKSGGCSKSDANYNLRHILLKELELLLCWHSANDRTDDSRNVIPPTSSVPSVLMRAAQAGDIAVAGLLIDHQAGVNETDSSGNTALHFSLRATVNTRDTRLVLKLVRHGASIIMGNRLGLTPVHIAAGQGHLQALQIFLALEPTSVHITAETKETPLFCAVKGNHYDCVQLLLQQGASRQVLNLRKQRPIDVADTSDMRALLSLQEPSGNHGKSKDLFSLLTFPDMSAFDADYVTCDSELLSFKTGVSDLLEISDESSNLLVEEKTEMCRYFSMPGGCIRGDKCFYAHREEELRGRPRLSPEEIKQGLVPFNPVIAPARVVKRISADDISKKIFVGGLSPSVESDDLRDFFEGKFGAVVDAIVIGSHTGDHIQSRGFGFVTFKHEESVIAAVHTHFVNIFGKKVEIKGAVPRSVLPTPENSKGGNDFSRSSSVASSDFSETDVPKVLDLPSLELLYQGKGDLKVKLMNFTGYQGDSGALPFQLLSNEELAAKEGSPFIASQGATWVAKFKSWLPKFLAEVSNRLKEGEWYPLSSLKGDFRATCGLELDHAAIGYHKLSDFVRSIPESCRMKIVPVGRGPATHMVLLPALARMTPTITFQDLTPIPTGPTEGSSVVDTRRSYAAATCQVPGESTMESSLLSRRLIKQASLTGSSTGLFDSHNFYDNIPSYATAASQVPGTSTMQSSVYSRVIKQASLTENSTSQFSSHTVSADVPTHQQSKRNELRLPESFRCLTPIPPDDAVEEQAHRTSIIPDHFGIIGNPTSETELISMRDLLARMDNSGVPPIDDETDVQGTEYPTVNTCGSVRPCFTSQALSGMSISQEAHTDLRPGEPKTPVHQVNLRPFSAFSHPFNGFLTRDRCNSYSMWGQQLGQQMQTSQTILERQNQQALPAKKLDPNYPWDDSPQSTLRPYGRIHSQTGTQEAPCSLFSPEGNTPVDELPWPWGALCVYCCERQSLWVAIPCNHRALCAFCKDALLKFNRSTGNCPVCAIRVDRWIALH